MQKKISNIHPGEVLLEEFLQPMNLSQNKLANELKVAPRRINEIVHGKRSITADTAIRLGKYFGIEAAWWLNLQNLYDLEELTRNKSMIYTSIHKYRKAS